MPVNWHIRNTTSNLIVQKKNTALLQQEELKKAIGEKAIARESFEAELIAYEHVTELIEHLDDIRRVLNNEASEASW